MSKRAADGVARHVDELANATAANVSPSADTLRWAAGLDGRIYETLHRWGMVEARVAVDSDSRMCATFFRRWIATNCTTARTANNYEQAVTWFCKHFGDRRTLSSITPAEFGEWFRWMRHADRLAESTANKHAKRIRTLFKAAIASRLLTENPGTGTKIGDEVNRDRDHYVDRESAATIIDKCDIEWAAIFGLSRFAGLRCPSEVTRLKWSDVDWEAGRLRIDSRKTGLRFCPLFPELRPLLDAAWDLAPERAVYVIRNHRDAEANLRSQLNRIIESAGLVPWPKAFVNLRASCRTDLEQRFPGHVCDAWLGHSSKVAAKHYLQVRPSDWADALASGAPNLDKSAVSLSDGGVIGGDIEGDDLAFASGEDTKKPSKTGPVCAGYSRECSNEYPRRDSNP
ncbi:tyrosine-type recombinase/integrase [Rosistilla oblonga]|uniref:tyrosine-type recombinase/integrase n=1 Tax=Rosistilla oblonga TaxID=2527990 RepID=UPI0018D1F86C|nr:site-specific integrase [Rosistilla oblonga]